MKLLPFESYVIGSPCEAPELAALLRKHTERLPFLALARPHSEFVGDVWEDSFRIKRVRPWRASFVPEIFGRFKVGPAGTQIQIEITPSDGVMTIIAALCGSLALMVFQRGAHVFAVIAGNVLLAWLFGMLGFWLDAGASARRLTQLLAEQSPTTEPHSDG